MNAEGFQNRIVDEARFRAEQCEHQIADDDDRDQVRQQNDRLVKLLHLLARDLVQDDRNCDRKHGAQYDKGHVVQDRIARDRERILRPEQVGEVAEAHPIAGQNALAPVDALESDDQTGHRQVLIHQEVQRARQEHQVQRDAAIKAQPFFRLRRARLHLFFQRRRFGRHGLKAPFSLIFSFRNHVAQRTWACAEAQRLCTCPCPSPCGERHGF